MGPAYSIPLCLDKCVIGLLLQEYVVPEVTAVPTSSWCVAHEEIKDTVAVVIADRNAHRRNCHIRMGRRRHISENPTVWTPWPIVPPEHVRTKFLSDVVGDIEVDPSIIVVIDEDWNHAMAVDLWSCRPAQQIGHIRKCQVPVVVVEVVVCVHPLAVLMGCDV